MRFLSLGLVTLLAVTSALLGALVHPGWYVVAAVLLVAVAVGARDVVQRRHSVLRNYPLIGHLRFAMEAVRPELQQYFIERNFDGRPFDRETRTLVYQRAKATEAEEPFGTEREVYEVGHEHFAHSMRPLAPPAEASRVLVGGPDCAQPYPMSLLNVSAMSFGSLSANAIRALNTGAARGGFAHDTGEGGMSRYHLEPGGDLVLEIGTAYFGCRTEDGDFDPALFAELAARPAVKCVSLKLSQGAKPGLGGVLPGAKVTPEIAAVRHVPVGRTVVSPPYHRAFSTPVGLVEFLARLRELAAGKPVGFKLCVGTRRDVLAVCRAMLRVGTAPDFVIVDGSEGGTGAAPLEFLDHVGTPLTDGLITVHNALVGCGLRDRVRIAASGKVATGSDIVKRLAQGADYTNAARAMMFAVGCIQAQTCHTNTCPVGVATQDPRRARALDVADKAARVAEYHARTLRSAVQIMASMGVSDPADLAPRHLLRRVGPTEVRSYAELYDWLRPGELLHDPPEGWAGDWAAASPDRFTA